MSNLAISKDAPEKVKKDIIVENVLSPDLSDPLAPTKVHRSSSLSNLSPSNASSGAPSQLSISASEAQLLTNGNKQFDMADQIGIQVANIVREYMRTKREDEVEIQIDPDLKLKLRFHKKSSGGPISQSTFSPSSLRTDGDGSRTILESLKSYASYSDSSLGSNSNEDKKLSNLNGTTPPNVGIVLTGLIVLKSLIAFIYTTMNVGTSVKIS